VSIRDQPCDGDDDGEGLDLVAAHVEPSEFLETARQRSQALVQRKRDRRSDPFPVLALLRSLELDAQRQLQHAGSIVQVSRRDDSVADVAELAAGDVLLIQTVISVARR
jgi:hypothetical protein